MDQLRFCNDRMQRLPPVSECIRESAKVMDNRRKMAAGAMPLDWDLLKTWLMPASFWKNTCRLTGQDVGRGTFVHRHAILHNQINNKT